MAYNDWNSSGKVQATIVSQSSGPRLGGRVRSKTDKVQNGTPGFATGPVDGYYMSSAVASHPTRLKSRKPGRVSWLGVFTDQRNEHVLCRDCRVNSANILWNVHVKPGRS
jgi:hypothetical protein